MLIVAVEIVVFGCKANHDVCIRISNGSSIGARFWLNTELEMSKLTGTVESSATAPPKSVAWLFLNVEFSMFRDTPRWAKIAPPLCDDALLPSK